MPSFGQKTGVRARMNEIKSGIPCSGLNAMRCIGPIDAIFCNKHRIDSRMKIHTPKVVGSVANQKVALSALGIIPLQKLVKK